MTTRRLLRLGLLMAILLPAGAAASFACDWWTVGGVIDWGSLNYGSSTLVHRLEDGLWEEVIGEFADHAARDGYVLLPPTEQGDEKVQFRMLSGATAVYRWPDEDKGDTKVNWYQVWAWPDVNNNGKADSGDGKDQNWIFMFDEEGDTYRYSKTGVGYIFNLLMNDPLPLPPGITYLLLLRVQGSATQNPSTTGTNLEFVNTVTLVEGEDKVQLGQAGPAGPEAWSKTEGELWEEDGTPIGKYVDKGGNDVGVDDHEILWIRVNRPPRGPRH